MGLGWATTKNSLIEGPESEVLVVQLGKTSKPVDKIIIPVVAANNQHVPQTKVGSERLRAVGQHGSITIRS